MIRALISFTALALALGSTAQAQTAASAPAGAYPSKPVRLIVPFPPGGGTDILSRLMATKLTEQAKWTVVADNKAGAGGTIGITEAVKAAPTGYDLVMGQKDNLAKFYRMVAENGALTWLKNQLAQLNAEFDAMAKDGRLQAWAQRLYDGLIAMGVTLKSLIQTL